MVNSQTLDRTLSALADPTRRDILDRLGRGPATLTELAQPYGISLPGLLKHVRILEEAELVKTRKNGRTRECTLGPGQLDDVERLVEQHRQRWERRLDRIEDYLAKKKRGNR
jgi:DNA-binding transcriptional ArsR family regulator